MHFKQYRVLSQLRTKETSQKGQPGILLFPHKGHVNEVKELFRKLLYLPRALQVSHTVANRNKTQKAESFKKDKTQALSIRG